MGTSGAKSLKKEEKDRDLECPICLTGYQKPKLLPCLHTFCRDCLNKYCDEEDDDKITCPLCRSKFCVPRGGVDKLPDNQFMVRLSLQKGLQKKKRSLNCDPCREIGEDILADSFCRKCRQSLCYRCTKLHSKLNYVKQHKVVSIEEKATDYELQRLISSYCNKHDNNKLELYCCDCRELICALCHDNDHKKHDCRASNDTARLKKELSKNDRKNIEKLCIVSRERKQRLVRAKQDFLQQVSSTESSVRKSVDTIRKLLDIYEKEMLEELISIKKKKIKELKREKDLEELHFTTLNSFHTYSSMVSERGTDCEIIRTADDLHRRALELIKDQKTNAMDHDEAQLKFIESMTPIPEDIKKLVGQIVYKPTDKNKGSKDAWLSSNTEVNIIQLNNSWMTGVTVVDDEIFMVGYFQSQVNVYDSHSLTASRDINIPDMTSPRGLAGCSYNKSLYIGDCGLRCIHRLNLTNNSVTRWKMRENHTPRGLSMTNEQKLLVTVSTGEDDEEGKKNLVEEYTSEGQLVREIKLDFKCAYNFNLNNASNCAWQTIQLLGDQFVVCYGLTSPHNKVSLINNEGQIIKSYGGEREGCEGRLYYPCSIAIDYNSKLVFVADKGNNRVLMLDADLTYLSQVRTPADIREPYRLYFDSLTDRLIVSELTGRVLVISPSH